MNMLHENGKLVQEIHEVLDLMLISSEGPCSAAGVSRYGKGLRSPSIGRIHRSLTL